MHNRTIVTSNPKPAYSRPPAPPCDHQFEYQGTVTWPSHYPLPGTGAHARIYADAYYCTRCTGLRLTNERELGNTYEKVRNGAIEYAQKPQEAI